MKLGYQGSHLSDNQTNFSNDQYLTYRFNNGVPNQLTQTINRFTRRQRVRTTAFYLQDSWTRGRMTAQGAVRYDHASSYFPEQTVGPVRFFPVAQTFPKTDGVSYNEITPRGGLALDVFGNGKTSLKLNFGRYLEAAQNAGFFITNNPIGRLSTSIARNWTDSNGNYVADCDLMSQAAQNLTATGGDICGVGSPNFGTLVASSTLDPALQSGWGKRSGDWQWGAALQQELMPRVSAEFSYQRRWLTNFNATDNLNTAPVDYSQFAVLIPSDPRLPDGGGGQLDGIYNITPEASTRLTDNFVTLASNYGEQSQKTNSVSLNVTARPRFGLMVQGGFNYANISTDSCEIRGALPETNPTTPWCATTVNTIRATTLASYTIPKILVQVATTFRSDQGGQLSANYVAAPANTTLGRPFAGGSTTVTVNLIEPGTLFGDRVNQLDLRFGKILRFGGRANANLAVDIVNVLNANPVLTYNESYTTTWLRPTSVLQPRFAKLSAQFNF
jgi:hypothetical protein